MDIWQLLRIALRRWYVTVPVALAAVALSSVTASRVAVEYTSEASLLLVNPEPTDADESPPVTLSPDEGTEGEADAPETGNPWLSFSGSLNTAAQAIQLSVSGQDTRAVLAEEGLSPDYTVTPDRRNPILVVEATADDPTTTQATLERVLTLVSEDLDSRQVDAGAGAENRIRVELLAMDTTPARATAAKLRVQLLTLGIGLAVALFAAVGFDIIARRRTGQPDSSEGDQADPGSPPATPQEAEAGTRDEADAGTEAGEEADDPDKVLVLRDAVLEHQSKGEARGHRSQSERDRQGFAVWTTRTPQGEQMIGAM